MKRKQLLKRRLLLIGFVFALFLIVQTVAADELANDPGSIHTVLVDTYDQSTPFDNIQQVSPEFVGKKTFPTGDFTPLRGRKFKKVSEDGSDPVKRGYPWSD